MNTKPIDWQFALLRANPFGFITPPNPNDIVWAGMASLKRQFEQLFFEAQTMPSIQVVLNWGAYGSGKTHAATYFSNSDNLPQFEGNQLNSIIILRIRTPKDPQRPDEVLYKDILESIRFSRLRQIVQQTIVALGINEATKALQQFTESEVLGRAIILLGLEPNESGELELFQSSNTSSDWHNLLESYFYSQNTKSDLKKLKLSRSIETAQERFKILAAILYCMIGTNQSLDIGKHNRVVIWIDEMEDLIYFATKQYRPFTQGLRELIDRLPTFFTLMMNFTLASPEVFEDTTVVLGEALIERITKQIYFQEPNEKDAYIYVQEMLASFRIQSLSERRLPEVYPFSDESLNRLISMLPRRTPREINKRCSEVISEALSRNVISAPGVGIITNEFIAQLEDEQIRNMEG